MEGDSPCEDALQGSESMTYYKVDRSVTCSELSRIVAELKKIIETPCLIDIQSAAVDDVRIQIVPTRSAADYEYIRCRMHENPTHVLKTMDAPFFGAMERYD